MSPVLLVVGVALTVVATGTSLPELAAELVTAVRRQRDEQTI